MLSSTVLFVLCLLCLSASSRKWNNTGSGQIALEEHWAPESLYWQSINTPLPPNYPNIDDFLAALTDISVTRLALMNEAGIDYAVLSLANPGAQGISDPDTAQSIAQTENDNLASLIANNTMRFGAFASLAMHNATWAAGELNRTVHEHGFLGALLNDYQQAGDDNSTLIWYDQPEFDVFWAMAEALNVPIYIHPRAGVAVEVSLFYSQRIWLEGPSEAFTNDVSLHALGLCVNGVFDRFPKLKIVLGHMGERIPSDIWRIDHHLQRQVARGMPMKKTVREYFQTNIYTTTSGDFYSPLLEYHISEIGAQRIMYSVDYPFESMINATQFFDSTSLSTVNRAIIARTNAINLLNLNN